MTTRVKLRLEIDSINAAFQDDPQGELRRVLVDDVLAAIAGSTATSKSVFDINGNRVGRLTYETTNEG